MTGVQTCALPFWMTLIVGNFQVHRYSRVFRSLVDSSPPHDLQDHFTRHEDSPMFHGTEVSEERDPQHLGRLRHVTSITGSQERALLSSASSSADATHCLLAFHTARATRKFALSPHNRLNVNDCASRIEVLDRPKSADDNQNTQ